MILLFTVSPTCKNTHTYLLYAFVYTVILDLQEPSELKNETRGSYKSTTFLLTVIYLLQLLTVTNLTHPSAIATGHDLGAAPATSHGGVTGLVTQVLDLVIQGQGLAQEGPGTRAQTVDQGQDQDQEIGECRISIAHLFDFL